MLNNQFLKVSFLLLIVSLSACSTISANRKQSAMCKQLSNQIVFNSATSNTRQQEIQSAQAPLLQHNYDNEDCSGT
jgi:hypothetical protein